MGKAYNNDKRATDGAGGGKEGFGSPSSTVDNTAQGTKKPDAGALEAWGGFGGGAKKHQQAKAMSAPSIDKPGYPG